MFSRHLVLLALCLSATFAAPANPKFRRASSGVVALDNTDYIVVLKPDADRAQSLASLPGILSLLPLGQFADVLFKDWSVINGYSARLSPLALQKVLESPDVDYVQEDSILSLDMLPGVQDSPSRRNADAALETLLGRADPNSRGTGVVVYGIDSGIQIAHQDFGGRASYGFDCLNQGNPSDGNGHGTHTASTAVGSTYGAANEATIKAVRVMNAQGKGSMSQVICGVDWVTSDAQATGKPSVAILSLGGTGNDPLDAAVRQSIATGVHFSIAAGNEAVDAGTRSPARVTTAITVGSIDANRAKAASSNYGPVLDVWYRGVDVTAAWIDSCVIPIFCQTTNTKTNTISGTSMAAPGVAGLVAVALSRSSNPQTAPAQVIQALTTAAVADVSGNPSGTTNKRAVQFSL